MWMLRRIALAALIIGLSPIALFALAFVSSWALDCPITENGISPCIALGADISGMIGGLLSLGFPAAILLVPPAAIVIVGWGFAEAINFIRNT
jgi:hypothetical protein